MATKLRRTPGFLLRLAGTLAVAFSAVIACNEVTSPDGVTVRDGSPLQTVGDATPPTVAILAPSSGASGVSTTIKVVIQFNETMDLSTINSSTFFVTPTGGGAPIPGIIDFHGLNRVSWDPASPLAGNTSYTVNVSTGVKDAAGNGMASPFSSTFTTAAPPDLTAPTVTSVVPVNGATGVALNSTVTVTFSEAMNAATITSSTVTLTPAGGGSPIAASVIYNSGSASATLTPTAALTGGTTYTVNVTSGAKDVANNGATAFSSTFATIPAPDNTPPTVTGVTPVNGASGVAVGSSVVVTFSEAMSAGTITTSTFTLTPTAGGAPVAANVSYNGGNGTATLTPTSALANSTSYTVNVTSGAKDLANNSLTAFTSSFTTIAAADPNSPTVAVLAPLNGSSGVSTTIKIVIQFNKTMNLSTINSSTFFVTPTSGGAPIPGIIDFHTLNRVSWDPQSPLAGGTSYTVNVTSGAKDPAGNGATPFSSTFTTVGAADVTAPTVTAVNPTNAATNVAINSSVVVTFSEPMSGATVTNSTFTLTPSGGAPVSASVSYNSGNNTATLVPAASLANNVTYTVNVASGAKDLANNSLTPFSSTFTTAAVSDLTSPTVTAVSPVNGATGVAASTNVVVTFSEPMAAATITTGTFTLTPTSGGSPVAATVTYSAGNTTATLDPTSDLASSTGYTVNVTSGAKDLSNNSLIAFSSAFTTAAAADVTAPTVTGVTPVNAATGVATSSTVVVSFSEAMSAGTVNGSTFTLTPSGGSAIATTVSYNSGNNTATLTPSSALANSTSYTVNVTSGAKDLSNNSLVPFSSSFTTVAPGDVTPPTVAILAPASNATGVSTTIKVVIQFNEAMNLSTINSSTFFVTPTAGGAPIPGIIDFHTLNRASWDPQSPLAAGTSYTVNVTSGAKDLAGNGVASTFSSSFTTTAPPDVTAPTVTNVTPTNAATNVAVNSTVVVTFSEAMNAGTVTGSTFTLTPSGGAPVAATVSYNGSNNTATLAPSSALAFSKLYTVNVTNGAKDLANNGLTAFSSTFTTAAAPDLTPPTVTAVNPTNASTNVAVGSTISVTFSEPMNPATVTGSTFTVTPSGGSAVAANVVLSGGNTIATLTPTSALSYSTSYTVNVTTGAKDVAGNALTAFSSTFTTAAAPDVTSPTVTAVNPVNGASAVAVGTTVVVTFSEAMNAGTVTGSTFTLTPSGGAPVAATVSYNSGNNTATLTPSSSLAFSKAYTVNVTNGAKDLANNGLTAFSSTFTTAAAPDLTAPTVTAVTPTNSSTNISVGSTISVTFSEPMNPATITGTTFTVTPSGGSAVAANILLSGGNTVATLTPTSALSYSTSYTVNVTTGAQDVAGNALTAFSSTFTTAAAPDVTPPTVTAVNPVNGASGVAAGTNVVVTFSEAMSAGTITTSTFTLTPSGGSPVASAVSYNSGAGTATLTPSSALAYSTSYTVNVTSGAKDLANNGLTAFSSTFTTGAAPDLTAPTITNVNPTNGATNVSIGTTVVVTFSEPMNPATVTSSSFMVTPSGGSPVAASVVLSGGNTVATLTPNSSLAYSTGYTVSVSSSAQDVAGNGLTTFSSTFTTGAAPDLTAPSVNAVNPLNNATNVGISSAVSVTFSEAMNAATITSTTFKLTPSGGSAVTANIGMSGGNTIATLTPTSALAYSTTYTVSVTNGAQDVAGNGANVFSSTFTTVAAPDVTAPTITNVTPANRAINVATSTDIRVTFSEPINQATMTAATFSVKEPLPVDTIIKGTRTYDAGTNTIIFTPLVPLKNHKSYQIMVTTGIKDVAGNALSAASTTCFSPTPGTGVAISMNGFWSQNEACQDIHFHLPIIQTGNTLSLGACDPEIYCATSAVTQFGKTALGGDTCLPSPYGPPRICDVKVVSLTGTVSGTSVNFTITMENGLTFTFNGSFAQTGTSNPWLMGSISGTTLPLVGIGFEREAP